MQANLADCMAAMAAIFGVKACDLQFPRADHIQMPGKCQTCGAVAACAHVLADGAAKPADCGFCPNATAVTAR